MKMSDPDLLQAFRNADDKKSIVIALAEQNGSAVWDMAQYLKEIGAEIKLNQFRAYNPKCTCEQTDANKIDYLKTIIKRQDEEIRRLHDEGKDLTGQLEGAKKALADLTAIKKERDALDEEGQILRQRLHDMELKELEQKDNQTHPSVLNMSDLINRFCYGLSGVNAYLTGRIVEALYRWRFAGEDEQLQLLPGLIEELANLIFDKTEGTA